MTFRYFAYGSNLLTERMRINCPSAITKNTALLKGFKLAFRGYAEAWKGDSATIIKNPESDVWGVIWEISKDHEDALNRQEIGYDSLEVFVKSNGTEILCKTYQKRNCEIDGFPSPLYKDVIIKGAIEHELPEKYILYLKSVQDNGYSGSICIPGSNN